MFWVLKMPLLPVKNKETNYLYVKLKTLSLFMEGVQLSQGCTTTTRTVNFLPVSPQEFLVLI